MENGPGLFILLVLGIILTIVLNITHFHLWGGVLVFLDGLGTMMMYFCTFGAVVFLIGKIVGRLYARSERIDEAMKNAKKQEGALADLQSKTDYRFGCVWETLNQYERQVTSLSNELFRLKALQKTEPTVPAKSAVDAAVEGLMKRGGR